MADDLSSAPLPPLHAGDHLRGPAEAPLVILYADFTCPHCALTHARLQAGPPLRVAFRHFALRSRHPRAVALACAAEAAAEQGAFWDFHDALFTDPGRIDDPHLWERAERLGLDLERFEAQRRGEGAARRVGDDVRGALRAGVTQTPTLFAAGTPYPGAPEAALLGRLAAGPTG